MVVTAAASVEAAAFAAALTVAGFTVALTAVAFAAVAFAAAAFAAVAFAAAAFAAVGSTIATSTIDSSSLAILGTRSFTISIHITATIPTAIILMVTDTAALAAAAFVAMAFAAVAFVAVVFAAVGDAYNEPVYQGSAGYTDCLIGQVQPVYLVQAIIMARSMARVAMQHGAIREYKRAHGLPGDGRIGQQLLTTMGLSYESPNGRSGFLMRMAQWFCSVPIASFQTAAVLLES